MGKALGNTGVLVFFRHPVRLSPLSTDGWSFRVLALFVVMVVGGMSRLIQSPKAFRMTCVFFNDCLNVANKSRKSTAPGLY